MVDGKPTTESIPRSRLRPVGASTVNVLAWARGLGVAAVAIGAAMWAWSLLRPLPAPQAEAPEPPPSVATVAPATTDVDQRERLLTALAESGNMFAPDRAAWEQPPPAFADVGDDEGAGAGADADDESAADQTASAPPRPAPGDGSPVIDIADIELAADPPADVQKELDDLMLRGVYATDQGAAALIGDRRAQNRRASDVYRVGDVIEKGPAEWRVLAIDAVESRVILQRDDVNVELRMYPRIAGAPAAARRSGRSQIERQVFVQRSSPEIVRRLLIEEGLDPAAVDEVLALAEGRADGQTSSNQAQSAEAASSAITEEMPEAPAGFAELLKMMASGSGPGGERGGSSSDEGEPQK